MAFRELQAMQAAYELLSPLDPSARQRVMTWLSAALADPSGAPTAVDEPTAPVKPVTELSADIAPGDNVAHVTAEHATAVPDVKTTALAEPAVDPVVAAEPEVAVEAVAAPASDPRPRRARSAKATGRRTAKAAGSPATATPAQEAPVRQGNRPSGEQFLADLAAAGSFKALAQRYGKSIGTIGNWANQLREQGHDIPGGRQKKA